MFLSKIGAKIFIISINLKILSEKHLFERNYKLITIGISLLSNQITGVFKRRRPKDIDMKIKEKLRESNGNKRNARIHKRIQ
ncbi:hypothetical protein K9L97_03315 [Candidatus Woesearchaeota archaeon]|nr:hypothetical protein [Candidatus Woesearchaeota archaeon]